MKALIVSAGRFEDSELLGPARRLRKAGIAVDIASTRQGVITGRHGQRGMRRVDGTAAVSGASRQARQHCHGGR